MKRPASAQDRDSRKAHEDDLFAAILSLETVAECRAFFADLWTPAESEAFSDRWRVAQMVSRQIPYRTITEETGVSVTTVTRVARCLMNGADGYVKILKRTGKGGDI